MIAMKKFIKKVLVFVLYIFILSIVVPVGIDPYNVFHAEQIRDNGVEPNKNYIKMKYILNNPNKFNALLFGSSRVGAIHVEKIPDEKCYNMTYSQGIPREHLENLRGLFQRENSLRKVYVGLDSYSYTVNPREHYEQPLRCPYEYSQTNPLDFFLLYLNPRWALTSLTTTFSGTSAISSNVKAFYDYGSWSPYGYQSTFNWEGKLEPSIGHRDRLEETLLEIQDILDLCDRHGVEVIVFTNPMHRVTYRASIERRYFKFLHELAQMTEFYNFSGLNDITLNNDNYRETSHYKAEIGDMMIEVMCRHKKYEGLYEQGFGYKVTAENVEEFLESQKKALQSKPL